MESLREDDAGGDSPDVRVVARSRELDADVPEAVLTRADGPTVVWRGPDERVVATGSTVSLTASGSDRFESIREAATTLFEAVAADTVTRAARPRLFGGFAFHDGNGVTDAESVWQSFASAWFVLPRVQVTTCDGRTWLTVTERGPDAGRTVESTLDAWSERIESAQRQSPGGPPGIVDQRRTPTRADWREQVSQAVEEIRAGHLRKVVLAQSLSVDLAAPLSIRDALARLDDTYPDCYRFAITPPGDGGTFFGATPERLVSLRGRTVRTEALAGSTGRGETPAEDEWLGEELLASEKDNHEHQLVVDTVREQLDPLAASVSTGERQLRRLATVQHLQTPIRAELEADRHVLSLVEALHPTPAVGGLPPDAALETIKETEGFDRGWYAAPVGWLDAAGNGNFSVAIRSALASDSRASLFAGAGIVADSDPDREWDEVQLKYRPMLDELA